MVVPRFMPGAGTIGRRFNIITLRDSDLRGCQTSAGPLRHLGVHNVEKGVCDRDAIREQSDMQASRFPAVRYVDCDFGGLGYLEGRRRSHPRTCCAGRRWSRHLLPAYSRAPGFDRRLQSSAASRRPWRTAARRGLLQPDRNRPAGAESSLIYPGNCPVTGKQFTVHPTKPAAAQSGLPLAPHQLIREMETRRSVLLC